MTGWIGVDLDGTLAKFDEWDGDIGEPVPLTFGQIMYKAIVSVMSAPLIYTVKDKKINLQIVEQS